MSQGVQESLLALTRAPASVALGTVDSIEQFGGGYLVTGSIQPAGTPFQARYLFAGIGAATGDLFPVEVGDEVVVLFPEGDPLRAVALSGGNSSAAALPSSFTNDKPRLVHPDGKTFATSETAVTQAVVVESVLPDLSGLATLVTSIVAALGSLGITLDPSPAATIIATEATPDGYRSKAVFSE